MKEKMKLTQLLRLVFRSASTWEKEKNNAPNLLNREGHIAHKLIRKTTIYWYMSYFCKVINIQVMRKHIHWKFFFLLKIYDFQISEKIAWCMLHNSQVWEKYREYSPNCVLIHADFAIRYRVKINSSCNLKVPFFKTKTWIFPRQYQWSKIKIAR